MIASRLPEREIRFAPRSHITHYSTVPFFYYRFYTGDHILFTFMLLRLCNPIQYSIFNVYVLRNFELALYTKAV